MELELDHLVVGARTLAQGVAWVESRAGVTMGPGGKHEAMGTHNRLLSLGRGVFLEVIAIDPAAPSPGRPRWFSLDEPATQERLARAPALLHWVVRTDDIERALPRLGRESVPILDLARGEYRWRIGVPEDGQLPQDGTFPTVIQWQGKRPHGALPDSGCRLESLALRGEGAQNIVGTLRESGFSGAEPVQVREGGRGLEARITTPRGALRLAE